jgi:hypothetical protein
VLDIPAGEVTLARVPAPPEGHEIAWVDVVVHLRRTAPAEG